MNNQIIEKLLNGAAVEWKPLGEVLSRTKGTKITAGQMKELHKDNAPIKIFAGGKTVAFVDFGDIPEKDVNTEPSIIVKSRGIIEFEYYDKPFSHKNEMWSYHSKDKNINAKFVYYFLKQNEPHFQNIGSKMQMPQIATPDTDKFLIPIPKINIQEKIVKTLDKFTELEATLEATLEAELALRIKQYAYYCDKLLNVKNIELKKLRDIALFKNGKGHEQDIVEDGNYIVVNSKFISTNGRVKKFSNQQICPVFVDDILIVMSDLPNGKALAKTFLVGENNKYTLNQRIGAISLKNKQELSPGYLNYILNRNVQLLRYDNGVDQTNLKKEQILSMDIPMFDIDSQKKIVEILDKFDRLTNSISEGLPKEIALRRKQYEYYRSQLLNFPKL